MNNSKFDVNAEVKTADIAQILGITARRVQQLTAEERIFAKTSSGRYSMAETIQQYIKYLENRRVSDDAVQEATKRKLISSARKADAQAVLAELEAEEVRGTMHRAEDIAAITEDMIFTVCDALTAMPGRVAVNLVNVPTAAEASAIVEREIREIRRGLADYHYDSEKYAKRVRERRKWNSSEGSSDEELDVE